VLDVREPDLLQAAGAAAAVLELHLLVGGAGLPGVEESGGVAGR
jgi:hypothetical protein